MRAPTGRSILRAAAFLATVAGVLLSGIGAMQPWVRVGLDGVVADAITPTYVGTDLPEGILVLTLSLVALVGVLVARVGTTGSRGGAATIVAAAGIAITAVTAFALVFAPDRLERGALTRIEGLAGPSSQDLVAAIAGSIEADLAVGAWLALAGGLTISVGGALSRAWANRASMSRHDDPAVVPERHR